MLGVDGFTLPTQILGLVPLLSRWFTGVGNLTWIGGGSVMGLVETVLLTGTAWILALMPLNSLHLVRHKSVLWICAAGFPLIVQAVLFRQSASPFLYFRF
jgi:hypothetical protein